MKTRLLCLTVAGLLALTVAQAAPNPGESQRLLVFGKVWGFLKYHHPGIARAGLSWDSVLVAGIPQVKAARSRPEFDQAVAGLLAVLGPVATPPRALPVDVLTRNADFAWLQTEEGLSETVRKALRQLWQQHTGPAPNPYATVVAPGVLRHQEQAYPAMQLPTEAYRLLGLFRYWAIIQYFYPYKYAIGQDWNTVLARFTPRFQRADTPLAYHLLVLELVAQLHDTHAFLYGSQVLTEHFGDYYPPLELAYINGQVVIAQVYAEASATPLPVRPGEVVLRADGVGVTKIMARNRAYVAASTPAAATRDLLRFVLRGPAPDSLALTVESATGVKTVKIKRTLTIQSLTAATYKNYFYGSTLRDTTRIWRHLPGNIGYLHLGGLPETQLAHVMGLFQHTTGLILDLRAYPQNGLARLMTYLQPAPTRTPGIRGLAPAAPAAPVVPWCQSAKPCLAYPRYMQWTDPPPAVRANPGQPAYAGKIVVLVNEKTQSYGETMAMILQTAPQVVVVGSQTAGTNGNIVEVVFPGALETYYSGSGIYYPDGRETQRIGIVPAIYAAPTLAGIRAGQDEVLDRAMAYITTGR